MNFFLIDIICVVFLIIAAIIGYKKGFVTQLYDFASFIIVLLLVFFLSGPLSSLWKVYQYDANDYVAAMVGTMINRILVGLLLFVGLMIIKKIIGLFIKPVLKGLMHSFHITSFIDCLLGMGCQIVQSLFTIYIILVFLVIPFCQPGRQMIENSYLANMIVQAVPNVSQSVIDMSDWLQQNQNMETFSKELLARLTLEALQLNVIDEQEALKIFEENILKQENLQSIQLDSSQVEQLKVLLENSSLSQQQIQYFISRIGE